MVALDGKESRVEQVLALEVENAQICEEFWKVKMVGVGWLAGDSWSYASAVSSGMGSRVRFGLQGPLAHSYS